MTPQEKATIYVNRHSAVAAGVVVATALVPGAAATILIGQEAIMAYQIAQIYGIDMTKTQAAGVATSIGLAAVAGKIVALEAAILTGPFAFAIKPVIATAIVKILGEQIIDYFELNYASH